MTKHIAFVSSKGGTGKSTICKCLHKTLRQHSINVWGDDNDPQQHFMEYLNTQAEPNRKDVMIYDTLGAWTSVNRDFIEALQGHDHRIVILTGDSDDEHKEAQKMLDRLKGMGCDSQASIMYNGLHHAQKLPEFFGDRVLDSSVPRLNKYKNQKVIKDKKLVQLAKELDLI